MKETWTNEPVRTELRSDGTLVVTAGEKSDAWRKTYYGFERASENAYLRSWDGDQAYEVTFLLDYTEQFDQAGLFVRGSESDWIKAGVEFADGAPQLGAVVTHDFSDWSVAPVPSWQGEAVTVTATRVRDAIIIRAGLRGQALQPVRIAYMSEDAELEVGLFCASPSRAGLEVTFLSWGWTDAVTELH